MGLDDFHYFFLLVDHFLWQIHAGLCSFGAASFGTCSVYIVKTYSSRSCSWYRISNYARFTCCGLPIIQNYLLETRIHGKKRKGTENRIVEFGKIISITMTLRKLSFRRTGRAVDPRGEKVTFYITMAAIIYLLRCCLVCCK